MALYIRLQQRLQPPRQEILNRLISCAACHGIHLNPCRLKGVLRLWANVAGYYRLYSLIGQALGCLCSGTLGRIDAIRVVNGDSLPSLGVTDYKKSSSAETEVHWRIQFGPLNCNSEFHAQRL
jgi:hypothetical protein